MIFLTDQTKLKIEQQVLNKIKNSALILNKVMERINGGKEQNYIDDSANTSITDPIMIKDILKNCAIDLPFDLEELKAYCLGKNLTKGKIQPLKVLFNSSHLVNWICQNKKRYCKLQICHKRKSYKKNQLILMRCGLNLKQGLITIKRSFSSSMIIVMELLCKFKSLKCCYSSNTFLYKSFTNNLLNCCSNTLDLVFSNLNGTIVLIWLLKVEICL